VETDRIKLPEGFVLDKPQQSARPPEGFVLDEEPYYSPQVSQDVKNILGWSYWPYVPNAIGIGPDRIIGSSNSPDKPEEPEKILDFAISNEVPVYDVESNWRLITEPKVIDVNVLPSAYESITEMPGELLEQDWYGKFVEYFSRPYLAFAEAAVPGARRFLLSMADAQLPKPEFTVPGGLAWQIEHSPWYKKLPEFTGWMAETALEFKALSGLFKVTGLSSLFNTLGEKLASKIASKELARLGRKGLLIEYGGFNTFRTRVLARIARTAPETIAFVSAWNTTEAARRGESLGPAAVKGALFGLGLSAVVPLVTEAAKFGMSLKTFEKISIKLQAKYPRLADYLAGKPEKAFIDAALETMKEEAIAAGEYVPEGIAFEDLHPVAQSIVRGMARKYKNAWIKRMRRYAAAKKYWAAGAEVKAKAKAKPKPEAKPEAKPAEAKPAEPRPAEIKALAEKPAKAAKLAEAAKPAKVKPPKVKPTTKKPSAKKPSKAKPSVEKAEPEVTREDIKKQAAKKAKAEEKQIKSHRVEILPRKDEILAELDEAIKKAPSEKGKRPEEIEELRKNKIHFEIDGGMNVYNTKEALEKVRKNVKSLPKTETVSRPRKKAPLPKPIAAGREKLEELLPTEDKTIYTDGRLLIKGKPPAKAKYTRMERKPIEKEYTDQLLNKPTKPAELSHYAINIEEYKTRIKGASLSPISDIPLQATEVYSYAIFKVGKKYVHYEQRRVNLIRNKFPKAKYGISKDGLLIAYVDDKPVAVLAPIVIAPEEVGEKQFFADKPVIEFDKGAVSETQKQLEQFKKHIKNPRVRPGFVTIPEPIQKAGEKFAEQTKAYVKKTQENISENINKFKFYPDAPKELRNAIRTDLIGALERARRNVYQHAQNAIWGHIKPEDVQKSVEIIFARDQLSRTKLGKGNPEISLEEAQEILKKALETASPKAIAAANRWKVIHDAYTQKLVDRGVLKEGQLIEDHVRHYVEDYTPEWAPTASIPTRIKRPFRGYAKKATGTTRAYRQDQDALLASLMEMEYHNLVEDFMEEQIAKYDIRPKLTKEQRRKMFGTNKRGYAKTPKPFHIYEFQGKRYRAYPPDMPFSRAIYMTESGEAALGNYKNIALLPEEVFNTFMQFSERGNHWIAMLNRGIAFWKAMAIFSRFPSFNVFNLIGDTWVAMTQHPDPMALLSEYETAINYLVNEIKGQKQTGYLKRLEDFIDKHDIKQTFAGAELRLGRNTRNPIAWLLNKANKLSDFRESINRVAYASSLLRMYEAGEGKQMVEAHDWIDTEDLTVEDALGKISREVLTDYNAVSKPWRRLVSGGLFPFGTFYFKTSARMWNWLYKHPIKGLAAFMALPIAAAIYNNRSDKIQELEQRLPDFVRNKVHFILCENPDGTIKVIAVQLPQDVLIGTKIFSIATDYSTRVMRGEMTAKEAAIESLKTWGISEVEGVKYLLTPFIRMYSGLSSGIDPYDHTHVYRRDWNKMTWDEKAKDVAAYILKTWVPFLGYTMQTYEKGLPQDVALKKLINSWAGEGALGIYDINKTGQAVFTRKDGTKVVMEFKDVQRIQKVANEELKYLGQLEKAYVDASDKTTLEFLRSEEARRIFLKIYESWAEVLPELQSVTDGDARIRIVLDALKERVINSLTAPRVQAKRIQVQIARAKTDEEKKELAQKYERVKAKRIEKAIESQPKTAREIELSRKIKHRDKE